MRFQVRRGLTDLRGGAAGPAADFRAHDVNHTRGWVPVGGPDDGGASVARGASPPGSAQHDRPRDHHPPATLYGSHPPPLTLLRLRHHQPGVADRSRAPTLALPHLDAMRTAV